MNNYIAQFDRVAGIENLPAPAVWLERTAYFFLILMVVFAPHSIAASQTSFLIGTLATVLRFFTKPRTKIRRTKMDLAIGAFFLWTVVTCFFSYEVLTSLDKLRGVSLFVVFYFAINNLRNLHSLRFLVFALILSCMVNVLWMPVERIIGRGVEIHGLSSESPLKKALLWEGDTLLKANGKKLKDPEELVLEIQNSEKTKIDFYRPDFYFSVEVNRADLLTGDALGKLGIESWKRSRNWRSQGFYGHYATYAEVLQLIISLVFGLFIASVGQRSKLFAKLKFSPFLLFCLGAMAFALLLTVTRASQLAFLISAFFVVVMNGNKKLIFTLALIAAPVALGGLYFLQQSRQVGFFDKSDDSTTYRQTVYREGLNLWLDNPRHFFFGVGMDTIGKKEYREKWHLFGDGKLSASHFHSTPIQLLADRGLFGLLFWLGLIAAYLRTLWNGLRELKKRDESDDFDHRLKLGVILGVFGGAVGFFTSGLVHYNLGDGEVAMVFYLMMGFGVFACSLISADTEPENAV